LVHVRLVGDRKREDQSLAAVGRDPDGDGLLLPHSPRCYGAISSIINSIGAPPGEIEIAPELPIISRRAVSLMIPLRAVNGLRGFPRIELPEGNDSSTLIHRIKTDRSPLLCGPTFPVGSWVSTSGSLPTTYVPLCAENGM
jgi:hypothetical protein